MSQVKKSIIVYNDTYETSVICVVLDGDYSDCDGKYLYELSQERCGELCEAVGCAEKLTKFPVDILHDYSPGEVVVVMTGIL